MMRAFRLVLPPAWMIVLVAVAYVGFELLILFPAWIWGVEIETNYLEPQRNGVAILAGALGLYRAGVHHPFYRSGYARWLEAVPWDRSPALPVGAIHLGWADAAVLAILALAAARGGHLAFCYPPVAFLIAYSAAMLTFFMFAGFRSIGYVLLFAGGFAVPAHDRPLLLLAVSAALYVIAAIALVRALAHFPWDLTLWNRLRWIFSAARTTSGDPAALGWPFERLRPLALKALAWSDALGISLLFGWWHWIFFREIGEAAGAGYACWGVAAMGALFRSSGYIGGHLPPISLAGRIATRRFIIPGYDRVFVAPLCAVAVAAALPPLSSFILGRVSIIESSLALALAILILLKGAPTLASWRLTGEHRIIALGSAPRPANLTPRSSPPRA